MELQVIKNFLKMLEDLKIMATKLMDDTENEKMAQYEHQKQIVDNIHAKCFHAIFDAINKYEKKIYYLESNKNFICQRNNFMKLKCK